jgi:glyoxylase-like metal-dependent hydrolase (beta-lactamase superfamily II)/rhodanese-related sulfurtransferase
VLFRQLVDDDLGCASYLLGDEEAGEVAVVDPAYAIEPYLEQAEQRGLRLVAVLETHTHADHVSGHGRLALERGVPVSIHAAAGAEYPHTPLGDGDAVDVGRVRLTVLHTPGHRPEHCVFAVADRTRAEEPWLALTGDSLLVGDAARPDLAVEAREGARGLFRSLHRLLELPDGVEVFPGHVAGSLCGTAMSGKASSTIGFERRFNPLLGVGDEDAFVDVSTSALAVRPPNLERIVELNRGPFLAGPRPLAPVRESAGQVLDVRAAHVFAAGHVPGALNVPLTRTGFGTRAAFVLAPGVPVVLHADPPADAQEAARRLRAVGFLDVAGYLVDPPTPARVEPVELAELEGLLADGSVDLVDVREQTERDDGYIPGSLHLPYHLVRACADGLPRGRRVVTICESGARAAVAASVLAAAGVDARPVLEGGVGAWRARGNSLTHFRRCGT